MKAKTWALTNAKLSDCRRKRDIALAGKSILSPTTERTGGAMIHLQRLADRLVVDSVPIQERLCNLL